MGLQNTQVILCSLWLFFVPTLTSFEDFINGIFPRTVPIMYPIFHAAVTGCNYLTVTIVMERILAIDGRFTDTKTWSSGITTVVIRKYILAVVLFTIGFNIPLFFETGVNGDAYPLEVFETDFKCHPVYFKLYRLTLELLIFKVTTWFGLTVMFWTITGKISYYTSKKRRLILSIKQVAELRDTRIVLGLVVLFFFTNALPLCISIVNILRFDIPEDVTRTGNLLLTINSSLKILIFVLLFPNFRHRIIDFILHPCTKYFPKKSHILFHKDRSHAFLSPLVITVSHLDDLAEKNTPMTRRDHACVQ
ncbi:unnamed protein product [Lepeophtheirus salmonis]|uniref:(salmon louse) hypothetical protein n=1 Tax=Lepeophtheirus salmonis TaxID=72036 RepID=A0A7R8CSM8_LEPSM|nr:unnamed protein product [Lepeophtheirus salmonis]CAF2916291.1 unnamed protein product [Lepeophtheirus salmonis]